MQFELVAYIIRFPWGLKVWGTRRFEARSFETVVLTPQFELVFGPAVETWIMNPFGPAAGRILNPFGPAASWIY